MTTTDVVTFQLPPNLRERRARAWFDTVFNPFIRGLEQELYLLSIRNWTYRSNSNRLDRFGKAERWMDYSYLDNLTDVRDSLPDFKIYEDNHDKLPNKLLEFCTILNAEIKTNKQFIEQIHLIYSKMIDELPSDQIRDTSLLGHFYETPQIIADNISEYFVNNISSLPDNNVYVDFYNRHYSILEETLKQDVKLSELRKNIENCAVDIKRYIIIFYNYIVSVRREISNNLDLPFVA